MAVTAVTFSRLDSFTEFYTATLAAENDAAVFLGQRAGGITIQSVGTIGSAHIKLQGSNDGTNYVALPTAVDLTATGLHKVAAGNLGFRHYKILVDTAAPGTALVFTVVIQNVIR
jgi:hypothetical protein